MAFMHKLRFIIVKEPILFTSFVFAGIGVILPAFVRPMLDSMETAENVPKPTFNNIIYGRAGTREDQDA